MRASSSYLDVARDLALEAGRRIMELRRSPLVQERKADHSLVTNADHAADRIIREGLRKAFPDHAILTEESGLDGSSTSEFIWIVDPLDGTRAFAKGVPGYSVMIGLLKDSKPYAGVVVDPLEGHLYEAIRGGGTWHTTLTPFLSLRRERVAEGRVRVTTRKDLNLMPVITSTGFPEPVAKNLRLRLPGPWITPLNSVGIKVGCMIRHLADIYINHHGVHYWDMCAPQVILEEAGGVITFLDGKPITYSMTDGIYEHRGPTVATNGLRHEEILAIVQSARPPLS